MPVRVPLAFGACLWFVTVVRTEGGGRGVKVWHVRVQWAWPRMGQQPFHGRVVILVNEHSASAAEMLAAFARENNLAKIVGTKTPGRLLSGSAYKVGHGFLLGLPVGAYLTWQGTLLEGKGVEPDETVDLSRDALKEGRDAQLEKAIEIVTAL